MIPMIITRFFEKQYINLNLKIIFYFKNFKYYINRNINNGRKYNNLLNIL